jgi:hypothetical protein
VPAPVQASGVELERVSRLVDGLGLIHLSIELNLVLRNCQHILERLLLDPLELGKINAATGATTTTTAEGAGQISDTAHCYLLSLDDQ